MFFILEVTTISCRYRGKHRPAVSHSKCVLVDGGTRGLVYVGSANFTQSTLANTELGVVLSLSEATAAEELVAFDKMWEAGVPLD